ncbi:MAG: hypothetical protein ACR2F1_07550 [Nitrososphaeraceae archaeon]
MIELNIYNRSKLIALKFLQHITAGKRFPLFFNSISAKTANTLAFFNKA